MILNYTRLSTVEEGDEVYTVEVNMTQRMSRCVDTVQCTCRLTETRRRLHKRVNPRILREYTTNS